jgi:uncharacterized protein
VDEVASDVEFLLEFAESAESRFDAYFGLQEPLEGLLGRPIDLVTPAAVRSPYLADPVARPGREMYAA